MCHLKFETRVSHFRPGSWPAADPQCPRNLSAHSCMPGGPRCITTGALLSAASPILAGSSADGDSRLRRTLTTVTPQCGPRGPQEPTTDQATRHLRCWPCKDQVSFEIRRCRSALSPKIGIHVTRFLKPEFAPTRSQCDRRCITLDTGAPTIACNLASLFSAHRYHGRSAPSR